MIRRLNRARCHALFGAMAIGIALLISEIVPVRGALAGLSTGTAYAAAGFLAVTLVIGPWNVIRGRANPVSTYLRRDLGIWAGILGLVHVALGSQVHLGGRIWPYFIYPPDMPALIPIRYDPFGIANHAGLAAGLILILLLAISNNAALRKLGSRRWKALQRWNYVNAGLVFGHGSIYQFIEERPVPYVSLLGILALAIIIVQYLGYRQSRNREAPS